METIAKPEAITEERVRSIFYSSFDVSQGSPSLQSLILARVFAKHPDVYSKFKEMAMNTDEKMLKMLNHKAANSHMAIKKLTGENNPAETETVNQTEWLQRKFAKEDFEEIIGQKVLTNIVHDTITKDLSYETGRKRVVNNAETTIYKFYLIEHAVLCMPYKGDPVWQEFFSDIASFLDTYQLSKHGYMLSNYSSNKLKVYFETYNKLVHEGLYTNKNCKEIDYKRLPLFS